MQIEILQHRERRDGVAALGAHDADALGDAREEGDAFQRHADDSALFGCRHEVAFGSVVFVDNLRTDEFPDFRRHFGGFHTAPAAVLEFVVFEIGAFSEAIPREDDEFQVFPFGADDIHPDDRVGRGELDAAHSPGVSSHRAHIAFLEADRDRKSTRLNSSH